MAYKDKNKQREAQRDWVRQKRIDKKGSTEQGSTVTKADSHVDASDIGMVKALHQGITHNNAAYNYSRNPVSLVKPKRGKDIKCFEDLPPDVQQAIHRLSTTDGKIDKTIKANRTAIAISYQHSHANRYYPEDAVLDRVVIGKPGDEDYNGVCTPEWRAERGR